MEFYLCEKCGKVIGMPVAVQVPTICCGSPMKKLEPKSEEQAHEKHLPVVEQEGNIVTVKVGEVEHPMLEKHHIAFIGIETNLNRHMKLLKAGEKPVAQFALLEGESVIAAYEYCNLHGLWKK